ncbi:hypothetical protein FRB95_000067 [Tulasnella sp. JGI-2019a]|nr:hypothetical protein FRB95_000067 [Tulasnella sp. JGI-2019a]
MPRKDKQEKAHAPVEDPTHIALEYQKTQLMNAFNDLASSMRKAANEAEIMATAVANTNLTEGSRAALQRNAAEMLKAVQGPVLIAAAAPKSPEADTAMAGVVATNPKKRPRPTVAEKKVADAAAAAAVAAAAPAAEDEDAPSPEESNGKKTKKEKKPKVKRDPNMPKKPPSAYLLYQNEMRGALKQKHPELDNTALLQMISKEWSTMPDDKKAKYQAVVDEQKATYDVEMKEYNSTKAPAGTTVAVAPIPAPAAKPAKPAPPPSKAGPEKVTPAKAAPVTAPVTAVRQPAPAPVASTTTDDDEESSGSGESGESESESGSGESESEDGEEDDEEEEVEQPPPAKKHKSQPAAPPIASVRRTSAKKLSEK